MELPLIELLLVLSMPLLLPLLEEEDFADFESEDLPEVLVLDLAFVPDDLLSVEPDILLSEEPDLLLLDLADGEELDEERELPIPELLPWLDELSWFDEPMPELPIPELPDEDWLPNWLDDWFFSFSFIVPKFIVID